MFVELISRKEAIAIGKKYYFTGKPCVNGHIEKRISVNGTCHSCSMQAKKKWETLNRDAHLDRKRRCQVAWNSKNKEIKKKKDIEYYEKNKEKVTAYKKRHAKLRPDIYNASTMRRMAQKLNATPKWAELDKIKLLYEYAALCSRVLNVNYQVDHIVPLQGKTVCGLHVKSNLRLLEKRANLQKGNRFWPDMW